MTLTVITAWVRLTKAHRRTADGWATSGYGNAHWVAVREMPVAGLGDVARVVTGLARAPRACVIRGAPVPGTNLARCERRYKAEPITFIEQPRQWLMIDADDVKEPPGASIITEPEACVDHVRDMLPEALGEADCFWQASASAGIKPGCRLHLWYWLSQPITSGQAKAWLKGCPVDRALYTPIQPHYTATPVFVDGAGDPLRRRHGYRRGLEPVAQVPDKLEELPPLVCSPAELKGAGPDLEAAAMAVRCSARVRRIWTGSGPSTTDRPRTTPSAAPWLKLVYVTPTPSTPSWSSMTGSMGGIPTRSSGRTMPPGPSAPSWPRRADTMAALRQVLDEAAASPDWHSLLQLNGKNGIKPNLYNAIVALRHAPELALAVRWNKFRLSVDVISPLPWDKEVQRAWTDFDDLHLAEWMQGQGINISPDVARQGVGAVASEVAAHPLREWLNSLKWDRTPRLAKWLSYYLGADFDDYSSAVGQRWMISAVARVFRPGCKADHVLVLEGPQGIGKSTAMRALVGSRYFTDEIADLGSKDAAMQVRGVWVIELAELDHLSRQEVGRIKAFLTRTVDRFRPAFGRSVIDARRECVFCGTVNDKQYLRDETGNRRFWPVLIRTIDLAAIKADRDQLWAEAVHLYRQGKPWWLDTQELVTVAEEEQAKRQPDDAWLSKIADYTVGQDTVKVGDVLGICLNKNPGDWRRSDEMRVAACLRQLGYERKRERDPPRKWYYEKLPPGASL